MDQRLTSSRGLAYAIAREDADLGPTPPEARLRLLDVLRGFAMFGVLLSNLNTGYGVPAPLTRADRGLSWAQHHLIEGRFFTLLGFLFGVGFAIQLMRSEEIGQTARAMYWRRLAVLLAIGIVHGLLIWRGDILTFYALIGFALPLYEGLSGRGLLAAAAITFFGLSAALIVAQLALDLPRVEPVTSTEADYVYAHGSVAQVFAQRAHDFVQWYGWWTITAFAGFLTLFVLGLWVGRTRIAQHLPERLPTIRKALVIAVACWIVGIVLQHDLNQWWPKPSSLPGNWLDRGWLVPRFFAGLVAGHLATWSMTAMYASSITLAHHKWPNALAPLASVGRMTLTTYLTQSVVCTLIFYSYGLGWYGRVGFTGMFAIALVLFTAQLFVSRWWLLRYRFGPVEWLWRSLTYGERQPMRPTRIAPDR